MDTLSELSSRRNPERDKKRRGKLAPRSYDYYPHEFVRGSESTSNYNMSRLEREFSSPYWIRSRTRQGELKRNEFVTNGSQSSVSILYLEDELVTSHKNDRITEAPRIGKKFGFLVKFPRFEAENCSSSSNYAK